VVSRAEQETIEVFKFGVDRDPQRLKRASGGVDPPFISSTNCAFDNLCEVGRRRYRLSAFTSLHDCSGNSSRARLFAVFKNQICNFYFRKTTEQLCCGFTTRRVHAHVERRCVPETEAARRRIQLQRRNTEVGKDTVHLPDFRCREDPRKFTKVSMHSAKARAVLR
jgi:hypothetical protein